MSDQAHIDNFKPAAAHPYIGQMRSHATSIVLVVGCFLSLLAFYVLNIAIDGVVRSENEQITRQHINLYFQGLEEKQLSAESLGALFELSAVGDRGAVQSLAVVPKISSLARQFDYAALYHHADEQSALDVFYQSDAMAVNETAAILTQMDKVFKSERLSSGRVQAFFDADVMQLFSYQEANLTALVMLRTVELPFAQRGTLITVSHFDGLLRQAFDNDADVAKAIVREVGSGTIIHSFVTAEALPKAQLHKPRLHELFFAGLSFELKTQFRKERVIGILEVIPYMGMVIALVMTVLAAIFARSQTRQAERIRDMNKVLGNKNRALETEVQKREVLNNSLRKSEHENREVVDSISDIIFEADTDGGLVYVNAAWPRITGFNVLQSKGKNLFSLLHPQDQKKEQENFDLLVKGQKSAYRTFSRLRTVDGTFRAVELSISMMRRTADGEMHVVGAMTDVEERRRAERALGEAEKKYRDIVENAAWGIYQMTPEGIYLSANPSLVHILGYKSADELMHKVHNAHDQVYGNERERKAFLREVDVKGTLNNHDVQVFDRDGQALWVSENIRTVKDEQGNILYYEGSLEDITNRKEADLLLREAKMHSDMANRAKSEFLTNMSHELRTPLNAIIGFSEIIKTETFGPIGHDSYKEYVDDIYTSGRNLLDIINEILEISRIETQKRDLNESMIDLKDVMDSCLSLLSNKIQVNQTEMLNLIEELPLVFAEERAMKQIFTNILSNAVKFTPRGGRVTISHEVNAGGDLMLSVTDNGVGLEPGEIKKALSSFGQVGSTLDTDNSGAGLGLTLVKSLVDLHGGKLEIFSQKGMGTTVTVRLPASRVSSDVRQDHDADAGSEHV